MTLTTMPFRGNFRQHFPPDFQHGNNAHFYAPNNGNTAHGAPMPPFFNGTGPPGTQYAGFPGPQSTFLPQMFHGQPEFVPHMNNNPHQHPQYYPPPPPPNDVHLNFVSAQQQQQLYPYPQQTPSQQATNLSLPPTLSSFLPFSSPLNGNHSQVQQHGPPALAPHQQLIHHTLPQAPPQQYQFHADITPSHYHHNILHNLFQYALAIHIVKGQGTNIFPILLAMYRRIKLFQNHQLQYRFPHPMLMKHLHLKQFLPLFFILQLLQ
ncbi:hypothetical protein TYRP_001847 [Tyrophagus putrescentiae]|nr:hypothetical protein TYRP_001847 [Tyrophagus putrescentiae]